MNKNPKGPNTRGTRKKNTDAEPVVQPVKAYVQPPVPPKQQRRTTAANPLVKKIVAPIPPVKKITVSSPIPPIKRTVVVRKIASNSNQPSSSSSIALVPKFKPVTVMGANQSGSNALRPAGILRYRKRPLYDEFEAMETNPATDDLIARYMISNGIPLERISDPAFKDLILHLNPLCVIPPLKILEISAERLGNPGKPLVNYQKTNGPLSVTLDIAGTENEKFLAFSIHFFEEGFDRRNIVYLRKLMLTELDPESLMNTIRRAANNYSFANFKFSNLVAVNEETSELFSQNESIKRRFICFYTHVNQFVHELLRIPDFAQGLNELRNFVRHVKSSSELYSKFRRLQLSKNAELDMPTIDDSSWNTTFVFLTRCLILHEMFSEFNLRWGRNIAYICPVTFNKLFYLQRILQKCVKVSRELSVPTSTMSQVIPSIMSMRSFISDDRPGYSFEKDVRDAFTNAFSKLTNGPASQRYDVSSLLDPRFAYRENVYNSCIWARLEKKVVEEFAPSEFNRENHYLTELQMMTKEARAAMITVEVRKYRAAIITNRSDDPINPFEWWSSRTDLPRLSLLAREFLGCPAVTIDADVHFGNGGKFQNLCNSSSYAVLENCLTIAGTHQKFCGRGATIDRISPRLLDELYNRRASHQLRQNPLDRIDSIEEIAKLLNHDNISPKPKRPRIGGLVPKAPTVSIGGPIQSIPPVKDEAQEVPIKHRSRSNQAYSGMSGTEMTIGQHLKKQLEQQKMTRKMKEQQAKYQIEPLVVPKVEQGLEFDANKVIKEEPLTEDAPSPTILQQKDRPPSGFSPGPSATANITTSSTQEIDIFNIKFETDAEPDDINHFPEEEVSTESGEEDDEDDQEGSNDTSYKPVFLEKNRSARQTNKKREQQTRTPNYGAVPENIAKHNFVQKFAQKQNFVQKFKKHDSPYSSKTYRQLVSEEASGQSSSSSQSTEKPDRMEKTTGFADDLFYPNREVKTEPLDFDSESSVVLSQNTEESGSEQTGTKKHKRRRCVICGHLEACYMLKNVTIYSEKLIVVFGAYLRKELMLKKARECVNSLSNAYMCFIHFAEACDEIYFCLHVSTPEDINNASQDCVTNALMILLSIRGKQMNPNEFRQMMTAFTAKYQQTPTDNLPEKRLKRHEKTVQEVLEASNEQPILPKSFRQPRKQLLEEDQHDGTVKVIEQDNFKLPAANAPDTSQALVCCYCSATHKRAEMLRVPRTEERLAKWLEKLGPEFRNRLKPTGENLVCRSHFPKNAFSNRNRLLKGMIPFVPPEKVETTYKIDGANFLKLLEQKSQEGQSSSINLSAKTGSQEGMACASSQSQDFLRACGTFVEEDWNDSVSRTSFDEDSYRNEYIDEGVDEIISEPPPPPPSSSSSSMPSTSNLPSTSEKGDSNKVSNRSAQKLIKH